MSRRFWRWWWFGGKEKCKFWADRVLTGLVLTVCVLLIAAISSRWLEWWL